MADKQTILYIEDDPASRLLVERTLNFAGYHVLVAENGLDGLAMARKEAVDLVLTDINLPDISGREVTTRLRSDSRFDQTPIVALTAQALDEQRDMTMAAGITGYLTKPIDVEALPGQIKKYLMGAKDHIETERLSDAQVRYAQELVSRLEERIQDLETLNQTLRRLDKMKDSFIQLTAHELRTPLTLVYGYSRLLQDNPLIKATVENDENTRALLTGLVDAIERMQGIVNEILTISRIMTNQVTMSIGSVNPGHVAQKLVNEYENVLKNRLLTAHLDTSQPGWNVKLRADGDLLHLALASLFSNAIKYTPDNGNIYFLAQADEQHIRISVKDTGIGVAKEEQERIFDRFHTAGDVMLHSTSKTAFRGGGLGLGLAVCKSIVEAHGGTVWVESPGYDIDKLPGSEFIIKLPLVAISPTN